MFESEASAVNAGVDVGCDESRFDEEGARAAHGVDEGRLTAPSAHEDDACGEDFVDGCFGLGYAVAALVERFARGVERKGDFVARDVDVDHHVGVLKSDSGALVSAVAVFEPVDDGVLDAVSDIARVGKLLAVGRCVDGESLVEGHERRPVEVLGLFVEVVGIEGREFVEGLEDAQGGAAAKICLVECFERAGESDHPFAGLHVFGAEGAQFVGKNGFQSLEGLGNHVKSVVSSHRVENFLQSYNFYGLFQQSEGVKLRMTHHATKARARAMMAAGLMSTRRRRPARRGISSAKA